MPTEAPAAAPAQKKTRLRYLLSGGFLAVAAVVVLLPSLLDGQWLGQTIESRVRQSLHADVQIGAVEFSPWTGVAVIRDIRLSGQRPDRRYTAQIASADLQIDLLPLLFRQVRIDRLELNEARIEYEVHESGSAAAKPLPASQWRIPLVQVRRGQIHYTLVREQHEPFHLRLDDVEYTNRDVSLHSLRQMLRGADLSGTLDLGPAARLVKSGSAHPSTVTISGVDLGTLSARLNPAGALALEDGAMDVECRIADEANVAVEVTMRDLKLGRSAGMPAPLLAILPLPDLQRYLEQKGGAIRLSYALPKSVAATEDLESLFDPFWQGLWTAAAQDITASQVTQGLDQLRTGLQSLLLPTTQPHE